MLFEGLICDAEFSFAPALAVYHTRIRPFFEKYCRSVTDGTATKSRRLGAFLRQNGCHSLTVTSEREMGDQAQQESVFSGACVESTHDADCADVPRVRVHDKLWGQARAPTKAKAKQLAVRMALDQLSYLPPSAYCTCSAPTRDEGSLFDRGVQPPGSSTAG